MRIVRKIIVSMFVLSACSLLASARTSGWTGSLLQYGQMREVVGEGHHQARVAFHDLTKEPHFFGIAALEGLKGEGTVIDGRLTATGVSCCGNMVELDDEPSGTLKAALLFGAYVPSWSQHKVPKDLTGEELEKYLLELAGQRGLDINKPFPFLVEGDLSQVKLHVINGACPMHARLQGSQLHPDNKPFETEYPSVQGSVLGIFAKDAVGNITHPASSVHSHLVFVDPKSGQEVTAHIERLGIRAGAILKLPE